MKSAAMSECEKRKFSLKRLLVRGPASRVSLATGISYAVLVWWCASEIAEPKRRAAQAVHQAFFDGSARAGFTVEKFVSSEGMPCLICTPESVEVFSKRAGILRAQMHEKEVSIGAAGETVGTILILHGRHGIKEDYLPVAERFCAVGFRCVIPDLPGHGGNPGKFTTYGVSEGPEILECYQEAAEKYGFSQQPSGIFGQSMGGAEGIYTAALEGAPFGAIVVVATFDKLETVIRSQTEKMLGETLGAMVRGPASRVFSWKTGVKLSEIRPMDEAAKISVPTMVLHGDSDSFVPTAAGKALYESLPESTEKRWVGVPGADHNNVLITDFPIYATAAEWFLTHLGGDRPASAPR